MKSFKNYFSHPIVILSTVLVCFWIILDFSSRFNLVTKNKGQNLDNIRFEELKKISIDEVQHKQIFELYKAYNKNKPVAIRTNRKPKVPTGLSAEQQLQQNGRLKEFQVGDNKLELKAVIEDKNNKNNLLTALILVSNIKTGKKKIERFVNNSNVYGYNLNIDKHTQVYLSKEVTHGSEIIKQDITLTMYKTNLVSKAPSTK